MKQNKIKVMLVISVLSWIYLIFSFSLDNSSISKGKSDSLAEILCSLLNIQDKSLIYNNIRSLGHVLEYFILGILVFFLYKVIIQKKYIWIYILFTGLGVILLDETIQIFTPGRSFQLIDIVLDSTGYGSGIVLGLIYIKIFYIRREELWLIFIRYIKLCYTYAIFVKFI